MYANKHLVVAALVGPLLAWLAWYGVGEFFGEKPQVARRGQSYPLLEKSNCRYHSRVCHLENGDFKLVLTLGKSPEGPTLQLRAAHSLEGVMIAIDGPGANSPPRGMTALDEEGMYWQLALNSWPEVEERIHLAAHAQGTTYYVDAATLFIGAPPMVEKNLILKY
ncbi:MAG: hypothetical protein HOC23_13840 [Halieaceae bacterium]|nr:hypothetical protein [Halieaceae bacterium]